MENVDLVGVCDVIGKEGFDYVFEVLWVFFIEEFMNWLCWYKVNFEKFVFGDVIKVSEVVCDLWCWD